MKYLLTAVILALSSATVAQNFGIELLDDTKQILSRREQAVLMNELLKEKQEIILPQVMRETGIDMWIVSAREGKGHVALTLVPSQSDGMLWEPSGYYVFFDQGAELGMERFAGRFDDLAGFITAREPEQIAVFDASPDWYGEIGQSHDSLDPGTGRGTFTDSQRDELGDAIGEALVSRIVSSRILTNRWLGTRTPRERSVFRHVTRVVHEVIAEAFSNKVVVPDVTTTDDLNWWIRQRHADLGIDAITHPMITIQRSRTEREKYDDDDEYFRVFDEHFAKEFSPIAGQSTTIRRGDLIFCDSVTRYLGLMTDTQQSAYVLMEGEQDAPAGIKEALRHVNRFQDLIGEEMRLGRDGDEVARAAAERSREEGIKDPKLYSHSLYFYTMRYGPYGRLFSKDVHMAGSSMRSEGDEGGNDNALRYDTYFALELDVKYEVPEWGGQNIVLFSETTMTFTPNGMEFPGGRQTEWYLIR
jgi:hypothetical protein